MSLFSPYTLKIGYRILGSKFFSLRILEAILQSSGCQCSSDSKSLVYDFFLSKSFLDLLFVFNILKFHNDKSHVDLFLFIIFILQSRKTCPGRFSCMSSSLISPFSVICTFLVEFVLDIETSGMSLEGSHFPSKFHLQGCFTLPPPPHFLGDSLTLSS